MRIPFKRRVKDSVQLTRAPGKITEGVRIYAVGDIHGHLNLLEQVLSRIDLHLKGNPVERTIEVFLGDYVDRGPASRLVIDRLIARGRGHEAVFLKGNHEALMLDFLSQPEVLDDWRKFGGLETLTSYGLKPIAPITETRQKELSTELNGALPDDHRRFLADLKTHFVFDEYYFVHAGVLPGVALELQQERDLLWIRGDFLNYGKSFGKIVVHGHTPVAEPEIRPNRINIDTGAYATGVLTCIVLEGDRINYLR